MIDHEGKFRLQSNASYRIVNFIVTNLLIAENAARSTNLP